MASPVLVCGGRGSGGGSEPLDPCGSESPVDDERVAGGK